MNVFLAPASRQNLETTILKSVPFSELSDYCNADLKQGIQSIYKDSTGFYCWAVTKNRKKLWNEMEPGDVVLFSEKNTGKFSWKGNIVATTDHCPGLGDKLWRFGSRWHYIFFLNDIRNINIPKISLLRELGYTNPNDRLCGIRKVKDIGKINAISE